MPAFGLELYLQFVFAWLTGNGDLHAKNVAILAGGSGAFVVAPVYDMPCTLLYGGETLALPLGGRTQNLKARHWRVRLKSMRHHQCHHTKATAHQRLRP